MNAAASSPVTSTWATPCAPTRVKVAFASNHATASWTAARCAASICSATSSGATAHSADTDFTGENVRSYPATAVVACREIRARYPARSRSSTGARPYSSTNIAVAISVRIRARTSAGTGQSPGSPASRFHAANAAAVAVRNCVDPSCTANRDPNRVAARISFSLRPCARRAVSIRSASGCRPSPHSARICGSLTPPAGENPGNPERPRPSHSPGDSPFCS